MNEIPQLRHGPPWAMEEMITAEPALVAPILASPAAAQAAETIRAGGPVVIVGCGSSEHAAMAGAALIEGARARDAFEASLDPQDGGVLVAISHEGGTAATLAALRAAANARTILITAKSGPADIVVQTPLLDTSACHTVGYLSPLLALTAMAGADDEATCSRVIAGTLEQRPRFAGMARALAGCERLIVCGSGLDEITAHELALKIQEGAHVPTTPLGLEKVLHGPLAAADSATGIIVLRIDPSAAERRDGRARQVLAAAAALDMPAVTIDGLPDGPPLLAGAIALQLLTLELVHLRDTNPDQLRRDEDAHRAAAAAAAA
jgi:glutamine---fructose-6-phosphate transaminase (isomerizing)